MTHRVIVLFIILTTVALAITCKKNEQEAKDASSTTSVTSNATRVTILSESDVTITFAGMIAHVFGDAYGEKDRAVALWDPKHHPVDISVPEQIDIDALRVFAKTVGMTVSGPSNGRYMMESTNSYSGFAVRVVGWDTANDRLASLIKKPLVPETTFQTLAPHLKNVSEGEMDEKELKPSLFDAVPDSKDWALFVSLDGGTLEAKESCVKSTFDNTTTPQHFASKVVLSGKVDGDPAIQFLKSGQWQTVKFNSPPTGATLVIEAVYEGDPSKSHFQMFKRLAKGGAPKFHDIIFVPCPEDDKNLDPACTNSQWP